MTMHRQAKRAVHSEQSEPSPKPFRHDSAGTACFLYGSTVLQLQLKSDLAKSGSGWILGIRYPDPVCGEINIRPSLVYS